MSARRVSIFISSQHSVCNDMVLDVCQYIYEVTTWWHSSNNMRVRDVCQYLYQVST